MSRLPLVLCALFVVAATAQPSRETVLVWTSNAPAYRSLQNYRRFPSLPLFAASVTVAERKALATDPAVRLVASERMYRTDTSPGVAASGAPYVWERGFTGTAAPVAIVDTGVWAEHPEFAAVQVESKVFLEGGKNHACFDDSATSARDLQGHGTRTASILLSAAPGLRRLYSLKAGFKPKSGTAGCPASDGVLLSSDIFDALDYAVSSTPARIINLSLGSPAQGDDDLMSKVMDYVADVYGVTLVFSAGNSGADAPINSPGISYNGITVANLNAQGAVHVSSTRGPTPGLRRKPDLAAVGVDVLAADAFSTGANVATGTSASAPLVSAAAALLYESGVRDPLAIKAILLDHTGQSSGWRNDSGWGPLRLADAFPARFQSLRAEGTKYFRLLFNGGPAKGTLVWNRHINTSAPDGPSPLRPITVTVYQAGREVMNLSPAATGNVLQLDLAAGDYIVKVAPTDETEAYAMAWSRPGLTLASAPALDLTCAYPGVIAAARNLDVACTATNTGGLDLLNVTGTLLAPLGFGSGGPQSFGNLAPGASRTISWTVAAAASPGTYPISATATNGVLNVAASPMPAVQVVAASNETASLNPAVVRLNATVQIQNPGTRTWTVSGVPAFATATVTGSTIAFAAKAATSPGAYQGSYTASNGSVVLTGFLKLTVPDVPAVQIERPRLSVKPAMVPGCPVPDAISVVSEAASPAVWFAAPTLRESDRILVRWLGPSGTLVSQSNLPVSEGGYCFSATAPALQAAGTWTAEIFWNGIRQASLPFTVKPKITVDPESFVWPRSIGVNGNPDALRFVYVQPDGTRFNDPPDAPLTGTWTVDVYTDHAKVASIPVIIAAPASVTFAEVREETLDFESDSSVLVRFISPSGAITEDTRSSTGAIRLPEPAEFGRWQARLISGNVTVRVVTFDRLPFSVYSATMDRGDGVYTSLDKFARLDVDAAEPLLTVYVHTATGRQWQGAELPIAGGLGARYPGQWEARAVNADGLIFARVPFTITGPGLLPDGIAWAPLQP